MSSFSDYAIYADESGSPSLDGVDPDFPLFVLVLVAIRKAHYTDSLVPAVQRLKFKHTGHDQIILHERDIRRQSGQFAFLQLNPVSRATFLKDIDSIVESAELNVVASVIRKQALVARYSDPWNPYDIALHFAMERTFDFLVELGEVGKHVHVTFEKRGAHEDQTLNAAFVRITTNGSNWGTNNRNFRRLNWSAHFTDKRANCSGLQLADLFARPIGLSVLRPNQNNRAFDILKPKIAALKVFP